jgi:hypothetical protein
MHDATVRQRDRSCPVKIDPREFDAVVNPGSIEAIAARLWGRWIAWPPISKLNPPDAAKWLTKQPSGSLAARSFEDGVGDAHPARREPVKGRRQMNLPK